MPARYRAILRGPDEIAQAKSDRASVGDARLTKGGDVTQQEIANALKKLRKSRTGKLSASVLLDDLINVFDEPSEPMTDAKPRKTNRWLMFPIIFPLLIP